MRRVACLSTIQSITNDSASSSQVIDIFNSSRSYNLENQITGAFIVSDRYLLIIVEGESTHLGNMVFRFRNDSRLIDFSLILNVEITKPEFTSWGIKVIRDKNEGQSRFYEKLNNIFSGKSDVKSRIDEERLDVFLEPSEMQLNKVSSEERTPTNSDSPEKEVDFVNSIISITRWPKPGKIKLSPELIKICARLVGKPQRFEDLLNEKIVISKSALIAHLKGLQELGILQKHNANDKPKLVGINGGATSSFRSSQPDRFGMVLRNFLTAARR